MDENNQKEEFQYIKEKVKQAPLNRKKLMRRTIITALMAVIFGVLACFTFLVLEPVFTNLLHPEEEPETVIIPTDTDEILPEDMVLEEEPETMIQVIEHKSDVDSMQVYIDEYKGLYELAQNTRASLVKVTSLNQDTDWFDNTYENLSNSTGLYVASNGKQAMILTYYETIKDAESISITFFDGTVAPGTIRQADVNTGLCIVAVNFDDMSSATRDGIVMATLANSKVSNLLAIPVIVIGQVYGSSDSVGYGMIASKGTYLTMTDQNYELLQTDIYGSSNATGIIVNLNGEVLGIIDQSYNNEEISNLISAIGISDIKKDIERMSNGRPKAILGISGTDVTADAFENQGVPKGAYVTGIVMGSPAMSAGIQSGDVIVDIGGREITNYTDFTNVLKEKAPDTTVTVTVKRQGGEEYRDIVLDITLGEE